MQDKTKDDFGKALDKIGLWTKTISDYPGFSEWKVRSIGAAMSYGDPAAPKKHSVDFVFPADLEKQHDAVMAFLDLATTWQALADTQFYFRRYPFHDMPISMETHLRYTCETYFSRVYEFSERLKKCLNALNEVLPTKTDAGAVIKQFGKEFRDEIRERNLIHHHTSFDELTIRRIYLEGILVSGKGIEAGSRKAEQRRIYRKISKEWSHRAAKRSEA